MNWTEADIQKLGEGRPTMLGKAYVQPLVAKGRIPVSPMNKWELEYSQVLDLEKRAGLIYDYAFEAVKLKLAPHTYYLPDFLVIGAAMCIEIREVKGFMREDANVKLKCAAEKFPWFTFVLVRKSVKDGWKTEVIGG